MPSSPADPGQGHPVRSQADSLRDLAATYAAALQHLVGGELETCAAEMDHCDLLLTEVTATAPKPASEAERAQLPALHRQALDAHNRLLVVMTALQRETRDELARIRNNRRAAAAYGSPNPLGARVESRV